MVVIESTVCMTMLLATGCIALASELTLLQFIQKLSDTPCIIDAAAWSETVEYAELECYRCLL